MTKDEFDQFYTFVQNDRAAAERLKRAPNQDAFFAELVTIGQEKGYTFTPAEIRSLAKSAVTGAEGRELTDAELETVAGGSGCGCMGTWDEGKASNW